MLVAVQATGDSATVVANVSVTPVHEACEAPSPCPFGTIALPGLDPVPVIADKDVRALYLNATAPLAGPLAMQLGADVALLGQVVVSSGKLAWPLGRASVPGARDVPAGAVLAATGWLDATTFPCGTMPAAPTDSLYEPCGGNYIMNGPTDDARGTPSGSIQVQPSAFDSFASDVSDAHGSSARLGTYLIRQVHDTRPACGPDRCYGWLMVGRLEPIQ